MKPSKFSIEGFEIMHKVVADDKADSGRLYVPKAWKGKKVAVVRLEE